MRCVMKRLLLSVLRKWRAVAARAALTLSFVYVRPDILRILTARDTAADSDATHRGPGRGRAARSPRARALRGHVGELNAIND